MLEIVGMSMSMLPDLLFWAHMAAISFKFSLREGQNHDPHDSGILGSGDGNKIPLAYPPL